MALVNIYKQLAANNMTLEEAPFPSELGMEAFLMDNPQILAFGDEEQDPSDSGKYPRIIGCEISLKRESENTVQKFELLNSVKAERQHSRLDILVQYSKFTFAVLELKKGDVGKAALDQLCTYLTPERQKEIIDIITDNNLDEFDYLQDAKNDEKVQFMGVLVGSRASEELQTEGVPTVSGLPGRDSLPKDFRVITLSRFRNTTTGDLYVLANKMMQTETTTNKDTTAYKFNNQENLNKGRLVNAVVRYYAQTHAPISYAELQERFPDKLQQHKFGVFREVSAAQEENNKDTKHVRYYTKDNLVIELSDAKIATCNQWYGGTGKNMEKFIDHATKNLGLEIEPME